MSYQKFKADYLFTGNEILNKDFVLITNEIGVVENIIPVTEAGEDVQTFTGILSPGFINCHCHLELSHLKNLIPEKTGLVDFVFKVVTQRHFDEKIILDEIAKAEDEMLKNGIVAVGDICNNTHTFLQKQKQKIAYYNFIEVSGWSPSIAETRFEKSISYYDKFSQLPTINSQLSMAPHAPYSVSEELWKMIQPYFSQKTTTIHNQETAFEDDFFLTGKGDLLRMYAAMNIDNRFFKPTGKSSLRSYLHKLDSAKNVLFAHNTFTKKQDIEFVKKEWKNDPTAFFCICANANLYIENSVPPIELLMSEKCNIVLGTDSLASNNSLHILDEMKTIIKYFPKISTTHLLQWATTNGAKALQMDNEFGSFAAEKKPGIILIENNDGERLTQDSEVKKIL
ncbi:MAG TPA: amidohydrolase family protein [Puia sp.]|jgi:cytosine/adenosine deaminase-related metal-dependent hydrolase|nr:amidohydrolase family protein [Puia sp.]